MQAFLKLFSQTAPYKHRLEVFRDLVTMSAIALRNAVAFDQALEEEYLRIVGHYKSEDVDRLAKLLALIVQCLDGEPYDVLGQLYMQLELGQKQGGQFFTPPCISDLMAELTLPGLLDDFDRPFLTIDEPTCGAGGMILAVVKTMMAKGHDPSQRLWVQATDLDRLAALMCYVQLSLWNVPAQVRVGDTLSQEIREQWFTPAHILGGWELKLRAHFASREESPAQVQEVPPKPVTQQLKEQLGFEF